MEVERSMVIQGKEERSPKSHVKRRKKVCYVCGSGNKGWSHLLVYCSACSDFAMHRYCLGIMPGSADDIEGVYWVCEFCSPSTETDLSDSNMCGDAITKSDGLNCVDGLEGTLKIESEKGKSEMVLLEDQPEPLQVLLPESFHGKLASDETSNQFGDVAPVSSTLMEYPEAIMSDSVLLVSPSGEITIQKSQRFSHDEHACHLETSIYCVTSSLNEISLDTSVKNIDSCVMASDSPPDVVEAVREDNQGYSIEEFRTVERTIELDFGTDYGNDVCRSSEPASISEIGKGKDADTETIVCASKKNEEQQVQQHGKKPSKIDVLPQSASTHCHPEPISLPASKWNREPVQSDSDSPASAVTLNDRSACKALFLKPIHVSEPCKSDDQSEMSIPGSVIDMAGKLLESTLEGIDVQVGPYKIRSELAPVLRNVLDRYGDIFHDCSVGPETFLLTICEAVQYLQTTPFKCLRQQHVDYIRDTLKLPKAFGVHVEWLTKHCDYLEKIVNHTVQYHALKQERYQSNRNVQRSKKMGTLKRGNLIELQEELRSQEGEFGFKENHAKKIRHDMQSIKSLWKRISNKSLAEGLF